jgi:lysophospholipase L1-like esterase
MLNDSARVAGYATRFEIVNAGVIGYNMWQVGRVMRRVAAGYQPDGVIVAYTFNDGWNQAGRLDTKERDRLRAGVRRKNLLRSSALFNWLTDFRAHRMARLAQRGGAADALAIAQTADTTASAAELAAYSATIDSIIRAAHELRLALAFVIPSVRGNPDVNQRQQVLIDGGRAAGLPLVRLGPPVGPEEQDSLYLSGDAVHPTPRGHALMARHMYAVLCDFAGRAAEADPARIYLAGCGAELHKRRL